MYNTFCGAFRRSLGHAAWLLGLCFCLHLIKIHGLDAHFSPLTTLLVSFLLLLSANIKAYKRTNEMYHSLVNPMIICVDTFSCMSLALCYDFLARHLKTIGKLNGPDGFQNKFVGRWTFDFVTQFPKCVPQLALNRLWANEI